MSDGNLKKDKKNISKLISIVLFFVILGAGFIVGFIIPLRPKTSLIENRDLTSYPKASVENVISGEYFSDVALWYSDSYPGRELMIAANDSIKDLYGIQTGPQVIGMSEVADEIPDIDKTEDEKKTSDSDEAELVAQISDSDDIELIEETEDSDDFEIVEKTPDSDETELIEETPDSDDVELMEETPDSDDAELDDVDETEKPEPPNSKQMEAEIKQYIQKSMYVKDGAAHSIYYFSLKACERYTSIIENAAVELEGRANVYNILVPNSSGVVLSDEEIAALGGSDQSEAVHYYYSLYDKATGIESVDILKEHRDEYLFFRTDHHWTALGAYYVYRNYCKEKGFEPHELDYFTQVTYEPFLGSYYATLKRADMEKNPDYITAYIPKGTNRMFYYDKNGREVDYDIIHDVSSWSSGTKYNCFIGGDQPMQKIVNPMIHHSNNSCLVIKESYGNCFVPFLVDHYHTVYVMDYRYCNKNVIDFVEQNGIDDVIIINNVSLMGSSGVMSKLDSMLSRK